VDPYIIVTCRHCIGIESRNWDKIPDKKRNREHLLNSEIAIIPQINKLVAGFGPENLRFYFVKSVSKIFFQDKIVKAKVSDISFESDGVIFELWNDILGDGKVRLVFSGNDSRQLSTREVTEALRASLSAETNYNVIVNTQSKVFHLSTSNHLPEIGASKEMSYKEALAEGYRPCGYCFTKLLYLPEDSIEQSMADQGGATIRHWKPLSIDQYLQKRLQDAGSKVLQKWPLPLIGYRYSFQAVEDFKPNAMALPGGHIIVTSGLLNSIENDEELEGVLAHEIAHVERRHGLRQYHNQLDLAQADSFMAGMMGIAVVGTASSRGHRNASGASIGIGASAVIGMLTAMDIYNSGYAKELEKEADEIAILFFEHNRIDKKYLINSFRKFEFFELITNNDPDPKSLTHPYLEERIARVTREHLNVFNGKNFVFEKKNKQLVQLTFLYQGTYGRKTTLAIYVNDYNLIKDMLSSDEMCTDIGLQLHSKSGTLYYGLNRKSIVRDIWGAYLLLDNNIGEAIESVENVALTMGEKDQALSSCGYHGLGSDHEIIVFREGNIDF
jgi:Zn-dependent protease with chaperone function